MTRRPKIHMLGNPRSSGLERWRLDLIDFRDRFDIDLRDPVGFSTYLLAAYGKGGSDNDRRLFNPYLVRMDYRLTTQESRRSFSTWFSALAPHGAVAARALNSLAFLPDDDIVDFVMRRRGEWGNYSLNIAYSVVNFATKWVSRYYPIVTEAWARAAAEIDPRAADAVGVQVRGDEEWSSLPASVRRAIIASQCPVVIISDINASDLIGPGTDSESGDTMEAEVHVKLCEPRCVRRIFVASSRHRLGRKVSAFDRKQFALDEHVVDRGLHDEMPVPLVLNPGIGSHGRTVTNLPDAWSWFEIETP